jgi:Protein of unknown function (DUF2905)
MRARGADYSCARPVRYSLPVNRLLIILGTLLIVVGLLWPKLRSLPLFRLPGDIVIDRPGFRFYFPLATMLIVSLVVSLLLWLFRR